MSDSLLSDAVARCLWGAVDSREMPREANRFLLCATSQSLYYAECIVTFHRGHRLQGAYVPIAIVYVW